MFLPIDKKLNAAKGNVGQRKEQMCVDFAEMRRVLLSERARIKCTRVRSRRRRLSDLATTKKRGAERKRCVQMRRFDAHAFGER